MMQLTWTVKHFKELSNIELYKIMQIRAAVFVVEQNCPYQDADNLDQESYHLCGWQADELVAYTRNLPKGLAYPDYCSIGRVITSLECRKYGFGKVLVAKSIEFCNKTFENAPIKIGAQTYLERFYQNLGFEQCGEGYLEDNIPHIPMVLKMS